MPRFVPDDVAGGPQLQALAEGGFRVDGTVYRAVLLTTTQALAWDAPAFELAAIEPILDPVPEFVLFGTGATLRRPPAELVRALEARGIGIDAMDSRAAARVWVILRGEGREVAAALMPRDF